MENTQASLLIRARQGEAAAWQRLVDLYRPLVFGWLVKRQLLPQDADDLTQDVLAVLMKELPRFEHAERPGAFRAWLRGITVNRARGFCGKALAARNDSDIERGKAVEARNDAIKSRNDFAACTG